MTEIELIIDLHKDKERQGPGSERDTLRALELMLLPSDKKLNIADIGCGTGGQTMTLAQNLDGQITAVDLFSEFLNKLNERSDKMGLTERIKTLQASMEDLPFEREGLDIIWSEGAIYNLGFEKGVKSWKDFLKVGGYLAVSDITWISNARPKEIEDFWKEECPEIDIASNKISILEANGYTLEGYFVLSQDSWVENYYKPIEAGFGPFLDRNHNSVLAKKVVDEYKAEIKMYQTYKDYYSYGFYIARRNH